MGKMEEFCIMVSHMFTESVCDVNVPWELPLPHWVLTLLLLYELMRGSIRTLQEFLWIITQLIIVSRMELLVMAMIIPFIAGKQASWCRTPEYQYGLAVMFVRIAYIILIVLMQLRRLSPECLAKLEAVTNA